jgi:hypothetical protein
VTVTNSIFSANTSDNCNGPITDGGHNLDDGTSCGFSTATGSLVNTNPQLDPLGLQNSGGPTDTAALCAGAGMPTDAPPALQSTRAINCAAPNNRDQRGFVRPGSGHAVFHWREAVPALEACTGDCNGNGMVASTS